jgi:hypothetical protein
MLFPERSLTHLAFLNNPTHALYESQRGEVISTALDAIKNPFALHAHDLPRTPGPDLEEGALVDADPVSGPASDAEKELPPDPSTPKVVSKSRKPA